jgi:hypothetical protein
MQNRDWKIALFQQLHQGFANCASGADDGESKSLAHSKTSGETGSGTLTATPRPSNFNRQRSTPRPNTDACG